MKKKFTLFKIRKKDIDKTTEIYTPKYESDFDVSRKVEYGQEIAASYTKKDIRNLQHHRKFFALLKLAYENLPHQYENTVKNIDELLIELKMQVGHRERRVSMSGREYYVPKSISFAEMGQEKFEEFYNKSLDFICEFILPGVDSSDVEEQIINFM